jgi:hypothetical protein
MSKQRIIDLQKQVKIAREALGKIVNGHAGGASPFGIAEQALDDMRRLDPAPSSAGLLGWEKRA